MTTFLLSALLLFAQTAGTISGRITSTDKKPVANIRVMALAVPDDPARTDNAILSIAQTDKSGNYRLENVPSGRYYVTAGIVESPTYYPGVPELASASIVTVGDGASLQKIDFVQVLPTAVKVSGRVVFASNPAKGVPGRHVELAANRRIAYRVDANPNGTFVFADVLPGNYLLFVIGTTGSTALKVDKDLSDVEIPIAPLNQVTGRIVVEGGGPVPRLVFSVEDAGGPVMMPVTDRTFTLTLPEGEPRLAIAVGSLPAGYSVRSLTYARTDVLKEPLRNTFLKDELVLTVRSPNVSRVTVRGRVLAADLKATGGRVTLLNPSLAETRSAEIRADGSFSIPGVLPGTYTAKSTVEGASIPTIVVGNSDLKNVEIVVPVPTAASMDPGKMLGSLSWTILDAKGAVVDRGSREIQLKDVSVWDSGSKHISLNSQFTLDMGDSRSEYRGERTVFSLSVGNRSADPISYAGFTMDSPMHAKGRESGEINVDVSEVAAGRWEIARTEFVTDVTIKIPSKGYLVVIQKGSVIAWPSMLNGKVVAN